MHFEIMDREIDSHTRAVRISKCKLGEWRTYEPFWKVTNLLENELLKYTVDHSPSLHLDIVFTIDKSLA